MVRLSVVEKGGRVVVIFSFVILSLFLFKEFFIVVGFVIKVL